MAVHAPAHAEIGDLTDALHALHRSVALLAGNARADVRPMIEIREVGQRMNAGPGDGTGVLDGSVEFLQLGRDDLPRPALLLFRELVFSPHGAQRSRDEFVAVHANGGGRNACMPAFIRAEVAILALDLQLARVKAVRICNWLHRLVSLMVS